MSLVGYDVIISLSRWFIQRIKMVEKIVFPRRTTFSSEEIQIAYEALENVFAVNNFTSEEKTALLKNYLQGFCKMKNCRKICRDIRHYDSLILQ